jgi:glucose/arabinose dehydrogenase/plastocyanin
VGAVRNLGLTALFFCIEWNFFWEPFECSSLSLEWARFLGVKRVLQSKNVKAPNHQVRSRCLEEMLMKFEGSWFWKYLAFAHLLLLALLSNAATHTVDIANFAFVPGSLTIAPGDTVVWSQKDATEHTVTSGEAGTPDGLWDSGFLSEGKSYSRVFPSAGTFPYFCRPHDFMTGKIIVQAAQITLTVRITTPTNETTFPAPGSISIAAAISPTNAAGARVEFFDSGVSLGTATSSPYQISANLAAGTHALTAQVKDTAGNTATSESVTVTVTGGGTRIEDPFPTKLAKGNLTIEVETVLDGLISPVGMAAPDDGTARVFVMDQAGLIYALSNGVQMATAALDVRGRLVPLNDRYDERGLLGLALHPNFAQNPLVYTYTSEPNGPMADFMIMYSDGGTNNHQSVIAEWRMDPANPLRIDPGSRREVMRVDKPQSNHNGGAMHFGPDGYLYISIGDGGAADDQGRGHSPGGNGQDKTKVLGKVLRIDVDGRNSANGQYGVPADNPFVGEAGTVREIYAYGFRNPYSFSFDRKTGELYLGDVGQNDVEEVDRVAKGGNYGWAIKEGSFYFDPAGTNNGFVTSAPVRDVPPGLVDPIAEYDHDEGKAIIGGYVYRGSEIPALTGKYVTADWGDFLKPSGRLFYLEGGKLKEFTLGLDDRQLGLWIKGFGQDTKGELYVFASTNLGPSGTSGKMLKLTAVAARELKLTEATSSGNALTVRWMGGTPPYLLQRKESFSETNWMSLLTTGNTPARVLMETPAAFYRVSDHASTTVETFTAVFSGAAERPTPVNSAGTGMGTFSLEGSNLVYSIHFAGLPSPATGAHIHGPATPSVSTNVMVPFKVAPATSGVITGSATLSTNQIAALRAGLLYANIHTTNNPGGEIRGQIAPLQFAATMAGANERPDPVIGTATGSASFELVGHDLQYEVSYSGLSAPAAAGHIHGPAGTNETATVMIPFSGLTGTSGKISGSAILTAEQFAAFLEGLTYVNIHTTNNPGGEIRGQILPR